MPQPSRHSAFFVSSTLSGGGAERFVSSVLLQLDRARFAPELVLLRDEITYPLPDDVPVHVLDKERPWHIPRAITRLARLLDQRRPEVIFSAFAHPNFITGSARRLARANPRWIARVSSPTAATDPPWLRPLMRRLYAGSTATVANAEALIADVREHYAVESRLLPNATDFSRIDMAAASAVAPKPAGGVRLVAVGRLAHEKRFDLLLASLGGTAPSRPIELVICGEGPERAALEHAGRNLPAHVRLRLTGFVDNPFAWIASADLFVLSSDVEGLPNALIEAQGLGIPAVATDCPTGPAEIVEEGVTGLLVEPGDADALGRAIGFLLDAPERRAVMGEAARRKTRERYSAESVVPRLEALLLGEDDITRVKVSR